MSIYIAFIRGINVGGNHMVKMAELRKMYESLGLAKVRTYINSGNVLFESKEEEETLRLRIDREMQAVFGFTAPVVLRTAAELERLMADCPFSFEELSAGESIHVSLFIDPPVEEGDDIQRYCKVDNDEYRMLGREIYFLYRQSQLDSKLPKQLPKLKHPGTSRNWKTIRKLAAMATEI